MTEEFSDIKSISALLNDARERIKEAEDRCNIKNKETEIRLTDKIDELIEKYTGLNSKFQEWLPLLTNLSKTEENKRTMTLLLVVAFISNISAWILTIFIYFVKSGVLTK